MEAPNLRDRVCLVTGASGGIGFVAARELAKLGDLGASKRFAFVSPQELGVTATSPEDVQRELGQRVHKGELFAYFVLGADPNTTVTEYTSWFEQPSGFMARGSYEGKLYFSDVQKIVHMQLDLKITIGKSW